MIAYLKGKLAAKNAYGAIIDVGGVGYELFMSTHALAVLPGVGEHAQVWTHLQVKEDDMSLYGFTDLAEKELFIRLTGVSGIGPKMALAALSTFKSADLAATVADGDVARIATIPGVGKKTAQRIVLELQGVLKQEPTLFAQSQAPEAGGALRDAADALAAMGFSADEAAAALKGYSGKADDSSSMVRYALKRMGGGR